MRERGERGHVEGGRSKPRLRVSAVPGDLSVCSRREERDTEHRETPQQDLHQSVLPLPLLRSAHYNHARILTRVTSSTQFLPWSVATLLSCPNIPLSGVSPAGSLWGVAAVCGNLVDSHYNNSHKELTPASPLQPLSQSLNICR